MAKESIFDWASKQQPIRISNPDQEIQILFQQFIERKLLVFCNGEAYIWTGTYYRHVETQDIVMVITNLVCHDDRVEMSSSTPKTVYQKLVVDDRLQADIEGEAEKNRMYINTKNGVYDITAQEISQHDEKRKFNYELDFEYVKGATIEKAPVFKGFVESSLGLKSLRFLLQIIGYCCSSLVGARCAIELIGPGKRGKSVLTAFLESVVDESLRSSLSFSDIGRREYIVKLIGKILNTCADNDPTPMKNESLFKRITACENVMGRDLYKTAVSFRPTATLVFASNHELSFAHPDDELWDRVIPLVFSKAIPEEKRDPELLDKLLKEKDMIMSMAIDTLHDLVKGGYKFDLPADSKEYLKRRRAELHPERAFLERYTVLDPKGEISSRILWENFQQDCVNNAIHPIGQKTFLAQVEAYDNRIIKTTLGPAHKRYNGFKGLRFKNPEDYQLENTTEKNNDLERRDVEKMSINYCSRSPPKNTSTFCN